MVVATASFTNYLLLRNGSQNCELLMSLFPFCVGRTQNQSDKQ